MCKQLKDVFRGSTLIAPKEEKENRVARASGRDGVTVIYLCTQHTQQLGLLKAYRETLFAEKG